MSLEQLMIAIARLKVTSYTVITACLVYSSESIEVNGSYKLDGVLKRKQMSPIHFGELYDPHDLEN